MFGSPEAGDVTRALAAVRRQEPGAYEALWSLVYAQLRRLAGPCGVRAGDVLHQTTDVVHEVFHAIARQRAGVLGSREQFFGFAALAMRRIAVSWARAAVRDARNRSSDDPGAYAGGEPSPEMLVALDEALTELARLNARCARVVELRWFCGLDGARTAAELGVSERTVDGDWKLARAWLRTRLSPS